MPGPADAIFVQGVAGGVPISIGGTGGLAAQVQGSQQSGVSTLIAFPLACGGKVGNGGLPTANQLSAQYQALTGAGRLQVAALAAGSDIGDFDQGATRLINDNDQTNMLAVGACSYNGAYWRRQRVTQPNAYNFTTQVLTAGGIFPVPTNLGWVGVLATVHVTAVSGTLPTLTFAWSIIDATGNGVGVPGYAPTPITAVGDYMFGIGLGFSGQNVNFANSPIIDQMNFLASNGGTLPSFTTKVVLHFIR